MTIFYFPRLVGENYHNSPKITNSWRDFTRKLMLCKYKNIDTIIEKLEDNFDYRMPAYKYKLINLELPLRLIEIKEKNYHERRLNISRVLMRMDLPSDLVPLICAFAVPDSKIYSYM